MKDRCEFEDNIGSLHASVEDLRLVVKRMYDTDEFDKDRAFNTLWGLSEILITKIDELEDTYCQVFRLNQYSKYPYTDDADEDAPTPTDTGGSTA